MPYDSAGDGQVAKCDSSCSGEHESVFANQYNYAGGFYGACGEERIMQSIKEDGPLVVALEVPAPFSSAGNGKVVGKSYLHSSSLRVAVNADGTVDTEHEAAAPDDHKRKSPAQTVKVLEAQWSLKDDCSSSVSADEVRTALAAKLPGNSVVARDGERFALDSDALPDDYSPYEESLDTVATTLGVKKDCVNLKMADGSSNGWEYTNHAVVVVGWGQKEDQETGEVEKYWIIRNSWGPYYGDNGYVYTARGINYAGLESQAVELKVDTSKGLLKAQIDAMTPKK